MRVIPRAGRTVVTGIRNDALLCRLAATPRDSTVNKALITLLSQALSVSRNAVRIQHGTHTRTKFVEIKSLSASDVRAHLVILLKE